MQIELISIDFQFLNLKIFQNLLHSTAEIKVPQEKNLEFIPIVPQEKVSTTRDFGSFFSIVPILSLKS